MTGDDIDRLLKRDGHLLICKHCEKIYGVIPDSLVKHFPNVESGALRIEGKILCYYRDGVHCIPCGMCSKYVPKGTLHKPMGDAPICEACYRSFKDSESCYIFEEDIGPDWDELDE